MSKQAHREEMTLEDTVSFWRMRSLEADKDFLATKPTQEELVAYLISHPSIAARLSDDRPLSESELMAIWVQIVQEREGIDIRQPARRHLVPLPPSRKKRRHRAPVEIAQEVMTAQEVAALLHMHRNDVYKLRLPELSHIPGHMHRYHRSGILRWIEEQANGKTR